MKELKVNMQRYLKFKLEGDGVRADLQDDVAASQVQSNANAEAHIPQCLQ